MDWLFTVALWTVGFVLVLISGIAFGLMVGGLYCLTYLRCGWLFVANVSVWVCLVVAIWLG